jgi:hypothetical protein
LQTVSLPTLVVENPLAVHFSWLKPTHTCA